MFDLSQIVLKNAARQHVTGTIRHEDLPIVCEGKIPEFVSGWRSRGHQAHLSADTDIKMLREACDWLSRKNARYQLGASWMVEHHGTDVDATLDEFVISIEGGDCDLISLFHVIFVLQ